MKSMNVLECRTESVAPNDSPSKRVAAAITPARVGSDNVVCYEAWANNIVEAAKVFPGFSGVDIVDPRDKRREESIVLVKFDTFENLGRWLDSPDCRTVAAHSKDVVVTGVGFNLSYGLVSDPEPVASEVKPPAYYKLVVLGILAVYPLVLFTNFILGPILVQLPYLFGVFLSVVAICLLMTYPVMPWLEKLLGPWLHSKSYKSSKLNQS